MAARELKPGDKVYMETAQQRVAAYQDRHKIGADGKLRLADLHVGNKKGAGKGRPGQRIEFLKRKGGNGTGLSMHEQLFLEKMNSIGIPVQPYVNVLVGMGRNNGYPPHYKLDFYLDEGMLAIEIDGQSHRSEVQQEKDRKKVTRLQELGYTVVRFSNREVATMTSQEMLARMQPKCLVEATILSVSDYVTEEQYVYDLQVEGTHCYFAHGLLVHNCQDLSALQWKVVEILAKNARRLVCAGDDDQAIYRWAGADVEHLIDMPGDVRVLGQSYRCPPVIQTLAGGIISTVTRRREKVWKAREGEGSVDHVNSLDQVDLSGEDVLILARNEYILREQFEPELRRRGILYERRGKPSLAPAMLRDVQAWERFRKGGVLPAGEVVQILEHMSSRKGVKHGHKKLPAYSEEEPVTFRALLQAGILLAEGPWFEALDRLPQDDVSYMRVALSKGQVIGKKPSIRLSTIHGAKGGQARHVIMSREIAQRTWREMENQPDDEARVWYVGVTRAQEQLTILDATTPRGAPWL